MSESSPASPDSSLTLSPLSSPTETIKPSEAPSTHGLHTPTSISQIPATSTAVPSATTSISASSSFRPGRDDGAQMEYIGDGKPFPKAIVVPKRGRHTNQLQYLAHTVIPTVVNHQHAWPFRQPVDPYLLKLEGYFDVWTLTLFLMQILN